MSNTNEVARRGRVADAEGAYRPQLTLAIPDLELPATPSATTPTLRDVLQGDLDEGEKDLVLATALRILDCKSQDKRFSMTDPKATGEYCRAWLSTLPNEVFAVVFLDTRHRVIAREILFQGTVDGSEVHPRLVVQRSLQHNAAAVAVVHNHPSGMVDPSAADRAMTAQLKRALALVDVRLIDHFVVGTEGYVSLALRGWV